MAQTAEQLEAARALAKEYGLTGADFYQHKQSKSFLISRTGIEKIQYKASIQVSFEAVRVELDFAAVKATASRKGKPSDGKIALLITIETFGSACKANCQVSYYLEMAEKRALSRAVLKLSDFYQLGVYGEDEMPPADANRPEEPAHLAVAATPVKPLAAPQQSAPLESGIITNDVDLNDGSWRKINGYEGKYWVSNNGEIYSAYQGGRFVSKTPNKWGYFTVPLTGVGSEQKTLYVHRLVALAFIPNPQNKEQVNHISGVKTDNRASNLEWATQSENMQHAYKNDLNQAAPGEKNGRAKLTNEQVLNIKTRLENGEQPKILAAEFEVSDDTITNIRAGKVWGSVSASSSDAPAASAGAAPAGKPATPQQIAEIRLLAEHPLLSKQIKTSTLVFIPKYTEDTATQTLAKLKDKIQELEA